MNFVNFKTYLTKAVNNFTQPIVGNDVYNIIIDSILISNISKEDAFISVYILREDEDLKPVEYYLFNNFFVKGYAQVELLNKSSVYLLPGDIMFASSDSLFHCFDCVVSYRELTETATHKH